jgi:hypothetical protein
MEIKKNYRYVHKRIAPNIYQRGHTYFYLRVCAGKKRYLHVRLPGRTETLAVKHGSALLEKFRAHQQKEDIEQFKRIAASGLSV